MSEVLFMRHPETLGNTAHLFSGRRNVELSDRGALQCARAVRALVDWRPDRILTSPLVRCRSIAFGAALCLGIEPEVEGRLVEIDFGALEGLTAAEGRERGLAFPWPVGPDGRSRPAPGAESFEHRMGRAADFLEDARGFGGRVACVTHGGMTRALLGAAYGMEVDRFWDMAIGNVSSQIFVGDGSSRLMVSAMGLTPEEVAARGRARTALEKEANH